jgi:hypothetical protein
LIEDGLEEVKELKVKLRRGPKVEAMKGTPAVVPGAKKVGNQAG